MENAVEAQKVVVQSMDDYYASPMFNLDVCTDFENEAVSCRSRVPSECLTDVSSLDVGIEAQDLDSLLDQFEEASSGFDPVQTANTKTPTSCPGTPRTPTNPSPIDRTEDLIQKIKSGTKRKSAILLPLGVPAKRGRGQALSITSSLVSGSIQKVIKTNSFEENSSSNSSFDLDKVEDAGNDQTADVISVQVNDKYYDSIGDHDYCENFPKSSMDETSNVIETSQDNSRDSTDCEAENEQGAKTRYSKFDEERGKSEFFKKYQEMKKRNYRKRQEAPAFNDDEQLYDRIPKYFSVLSRPITPAKPSSAMNIQNNDSLPERDPSPDRINNDQLFNKLPAYHNCFTNSSKYDSNANVGPTSVQSSRSNTPLLIDSRAPSRSRSRSVSSHAHSRSRSRSRSRSGLRRRSPRFSRRRSSRERSRSHSRGRSRQKTRRRRSYSSSSSSDRSRSRSYSRSRSPISRRRVSRDRSASRERYYAEMEKEREEEKRKQIEQRRIVYIGKIPHDFTRTDIKRIFSRFGEIEETSVHFREAGDNYGFATFVYTCDAYAAVGKGNLVPGCEGFDLCFGGRRHFCKNDYADLDGDNEIREEFTPQAKKSSGEPNFDDLLQQAIKQAKRK